MVQDHIQKLHVFAHDLRAFFVAGSDTARLSKGVCTSNHGVQPAPDRSDCGTIRFL